MFRTGFLSIIRSSKLHIQSQVFVRPILLPAASRPGYAARIAVSKPVWHTPLLCVQWKTPDDGQRNCPKYVEFYSKNKFEKLVHLVGFIVRICLTTIPFFFIFFFPFIIYRNYGPMLLTFIYSLYICVFYILIYAYVLIILMFLNINLQHIKIPFP